MGTRRQGGCIPCEFRCFPSVPRGRSPLPPTTLLPLEPAAMKRNPFSTKKNSARRGSKQPSSGALIPFAGSSSGALAPFAVPAAATAVITKRRLGDEGATAASAAATLYDDGGSQVAVAATPVAATPSAAALTFHESEDEVVPMSTIQSAPQKRKKAPSVRATAPAATEAAQTELTFAVERCRRDLHCRNCMSVIPEGGLRLLRIRTMKGAQREGKRSQHLECSRPPTLSSVEELRGFEALALPDAERVRAWFGVSDTGASPAILPLVAAPPLPTPAEESETRRRDRLRANKRHRAHKSREGKQHERVVTHRRSTARRMRSTARRMRMHMHMHMPSLSHNLYSSQGSWFRGERSTCT